MKINYDLLGRALIHPVQKRILSHMFISSISKISPKELSMDLEIPLATVSYHVRLLAGLNCSKQKSPYASKPLLREVDIKQRRGALEHFYALTNAAKGSPE